MKDEIKYHDDQNCECGRNMDDFFDSQDFRTADSVHPHLDSRIDFNDADSTIYKCTCGNLYYWSEGGLMFFKLPSNYLDEDYNLDNNEALLKRLLDEIEGLRKSIKVSLMFGHLRDFDYIKGIVNERLDLMKREIEEKSGVSLDEHPNFDPYEIEWEEEAKENLNK